MRILVIESDAATPRVIARAVPGSHEVVVFGSGRAAIERIAIGRPFDVVLCEMDPPDMTAKQLYEMLEDGSPRTAQRMVFLVTDAKFDREFLETPAKRYLTRPVDPAALREVLAEMA